MSLHLVSFLASFLFVINNPVRPISAHGCVAFHWGMSNLLVITSPKERDSRDLGLRSDGRRHCSFCLFPEILITWFKLYMASNSLIEMSDLWYWDHFPGVLSQSYCKMTWEPFRNTHSYKGQVYLKKHNLLPKGIYFYWGTCLCFTVDSIMRLIIHIKH